MLHTFPVPGVGKAALDVDDHEGVWMRKVSAASRGRRRPVRHLDASDLAGPGYKA